MALAASLGAGRCQIFTDVKGIYTADPRLVTKARQLPVIGYEEMLELAHQGAQVMQVRAVELGWVNGVVIEVLSSFEDAPGTLIKEDPLVEQRNKVRGLAHDRNVAKVTVVAVPDRPGVARSIFDPLAEAGINVDMIVQNVGHGGETDLSFTVPRVELAAAKKTLDPLVRELAARELTTDASVAKVSIVGAGLHNAPGYAARMFGTLADAGRQHRDDLDLRGADHLHDRRGRPRDRAARAARRLRARTTREGRRHRCRRGGGRMSDAPSMTPFLARREHLARVGSTNDVVRDWLAAGTPEVCLAGRRRADRGSRAGWSELGRAARRRAARVARVPADLAGARPGLAAGGRRVAGDGRGGRDGRRAARRDRPAQVAQRPGHRDA